LAWGFGLAGLYVVVEAILFVVMTAVYCTNLSAK
jgi:hypothetical protein